MARWEAFRPFRAWLESELYRREWRPIDLARRINPDAPANVASSISKWMSGKRQPDTASCALLADILGTDLDYVLELAGHKPKREGDVLIDSITASLRSLPRAQVEMISTTVRALHDEATRRRPEGDDPVSGGRPDGGDAPKRRSKIAKASDAGNTTLAIAPLELIVAANHYGPSLRRVAAVVSALAVAIIGG